MREGFSPLDDIQTHAEDLRVEFVYQGKSYARWIGSMSRTSALRFVMLACNICPSKRKSIERVRIRTRKEVDRWTPPKNPKPAW